MIRIIDWVMVVCGVLIWAILSGLGVWMLKEKGVAYAWGAFCGALRCYLSHFVYCADCLQRETRLWNQTRVRQALVLRKVLNDPSGTRRASGKPLLRRLLPPPPAQARAPSGGVQPRRGRPVGGAVAPEAANPKGSGRETLKVGLTAPRITGWG